MVSRAGGRDRLPDVGAAMRATFAAFIVMGFVFASWAARIPQVRDRLALDSAELGLVLLSVAAGALVALPLSGSIVTRFGSGPTVAVLAVLDGAALAVVAVGQLVDVSLVVIGLAGFGFAQGGWDVAMNVQGAVVERRLGRPIMPWLHAGFSVGTVAGAVTGAGLVAAGAGVAVHLLVVAVVTGGVMPFVAGAFLPDADDAGTTGTGHGEAEGLIVTGGTDGVGGDAGAGLRGALVVWREPRTLLIGVLVLAFAFAEGTGNDWTGVALIDGYGVSAPAGTLGFAAFLAAMTAGRVAGPVLLHRWGRVRTLRTLALVGVLGVVLTVGGGSVPVAFAGLVLWGVGLSLGFPVGMSAGADEPVMAARRVSVISSIGYCAFLAGPPLIGLLAEHSTLLRAMLSVAVLLAGAAAIAGVVRPLPASRDGRPGS